MDGALTGKEGSSARPSVRFEVNLIAKSEACLIEIIPWEVLPSCSLKVPKNPVYGHFGPECSHTHMKDGNVHSLSNEPFLVVIEQRT